MRRVAQTNYGGMMTTVALPIWNSQDIAWLQLESLCRQQDAGEWELIVSECERKDMDDLILERYIERLFARGCRRVYTIHNPTRLPLGEKWWQIAQNARGDAMLLCAADNYSYPTRIRDAANAIAQGFDFLDVDEGLFLDIPTGRTATWTRPRDTKPGLFMAYRTELLRGLTGEPPPIGIDSWIRDQIGPIRWKRLPAQLGLHTDGSNTISHYRAGLYTNGPQFPFVEARQDVGDILPKSLVWNLRQAEIVNNEDWK